MKRKAKELKPKETDGELDIISKHTSTIIKNEEEVNNINVETYINNCKKFGLITDPSVVISLRTGWDILKPTKSFDDGSMLALMDILNNDKNITKYNLSDISMRTYRSTGNGNSNARALVEILKSNNTVKELNLSNTGLDDDGIKEICDGIKENNSLIYLNLSRNHFSEIGADYLAKALSFNNSIKKLDLSQNALG